jgi:hypothetical protein
MSLIPKRSVLTTMLRKAFPLADDLTIACWTLSETNYKQIVSFQRATHKVLESRYFSERLIILAADAARSVILLHSVFLCEV